MKKLMTLAVVILLCLSTLLVGVQYTAAEEYIEYPGVGTELAADRTANSKTFLKRQYTDGRMDYTTVASIGSVHYLNDAGMWQDIDATPVFGSGQWTVDKGQWTLTLKPDTTIVASKEGLAVGFRLRSMGYIDITTKQFYLIQSRQDSTPTVQTTNDVVNGLPHSRTTWTWTNIFSGVNLQLVYTADALHESIFMSQSARDGLPRPSDFSLDAANVYLGFVYDADWSGVDKLAGQAGEVLNVDEAYEFDGRLNLRNIADKVIAVLPAYYAKTDSLLPEDWVPLRKRLYTQGDSHYILVGAPVLPLAALPDGVIEFDPSISVGTSADDDQVYRTGSFWDNADVNLAVGYHDASYYQGGGSMRFTGVNIPAGATVTLAYLSLTCSYSQSGTTVNSDICCENSNNPGQIAGLADHVGRSRTASVAWDAIPSWAQGTVYQSPYIQTPIQTVVDDNSGTGSALIVFWEDKDDETTHAANCLRPAAPWDHLSYNPPAIYIEWNAAGVTAATQSFIY